MQVGPPPLRAKWWMIFCYLMVMLAPWEGRLESGSRPLWLRSTRREAGPSMTALTEAISAIRLLNPFNGSGPTKSPHADGYGSVLNRIRMALDFAL